MYLWKYWRESRIVFGCGVLVVAILFALVFKEKFSPEMHIDAVGLSAGFPTAFYMLAVVFSLWGWAFGSFGVGRDLGEKSGSFLLCRPRKRGYFIWCDWGYGLAQLLVLVILATLVQWYQTHRLIAFAGDALHGYVQFPNATIPLISAHLITGSAIFLTVAMVFSVTYFFSIVMKHSRGAFLGGVIVVGYIVGRIILHHYWPAVSLPGFTAPAFIFHPQGLNYFRFDGIADHLWLKMALYAGVVLLFPIAAHVLIEKADI